MSDFIAASCLLIFNEQPQLLACEALLTQRVGSAGGLCIELWDSFDACGVSSRGIWAGDGRHSDGRRRSVV